MRILLAVPAYNEAACIEHTVRTLRSFFDRELSQHDCTIVIADNGSSDATNAISAGLARELSNVQHLTLERRGKGRAIQAAWDTIEADAYLFTDADLPYGSKTILQLVRTLESGADIAVVSRLLHASSRHQPPLRKHITLLGNYMLHALFKNNFSDAQAGCKALSKHAYQSLLPHMAEPGWFFDTRLLLEAERRGIAIQEIPSSNVDPRPRSLHPNVNFELCMKVIALRVRWWIEAQNQTAYAKEPRLYP